MVLSITGAVPAEVCERLRGIEGIVSVDAI
jgi:hypothetical protein